jgi:predicted nucleotidyltransferase
MPDAPQQTHPEDLQSDLDLLVEMTREPKRDAQAIHRHLESLKSKLDKFIHERGIHSDGGSA